ncbi:MAG: Lrp/AsnC family transcriptional regulator [Ignavibacteriales bacterium]
MPVSLDDQERQIIRLLQKNGRMSYVDIATAIGVTEGTVRRKVQRLTSEGVIKIVAVANPHALGFKAPAIVGLKVDLERLEDAVRALDKLPAVRYIGLTTGNYDIIIEGIWEDNEQLSSFLLQELPRVPGIREFQTSLLLRIARQIYDWGFPAETNPPGHG